MYMWVSKQKKNLQANISGGEQYSSSSYKQWKSGGIFNKMFFLFFLNKILVWYIYNNFTQLLKNKFQVKFSY